MLIKPNRFKIGTIVKVSGKTKLEYLGNLRFVHTYSVRTKDIIGAIIGIATKLEGKRLKSPQAPHGFDGEHYFEPERKIMLWEVKIAWMNKPILCADFQVYPSSRDYDLPMYDQKINKYFIKDSVWKSEMGEN